MSAGYSGRPLAQKLGIRRGDVLAFLNAPDDYDSILGKTARRSDRCPRAEREVGLHPAVRHRQGKLRERVLG
jgi:hypothetical protein